jgi:hypothetical protein
MLSIHLRLGLTSGLFPLAFLPITYTSSSSPPFVPHVDVTMTEVITTNFGMQKCCWIFCCDPTVTEIINANFGRQKNCRIFCCDMTVTDVIKYRFAETDGTYCSCKSSCEIPSENPLLLPCSLFPSAVICLTFKSPKNCRSYLHIGILSDIFLRVLLISARA